MVACQETQTADLFRSVLSEDELVQGELAPGQLESLSAEAFLEWAACQFGDSLAVSTSFGIQSAVTLHLAVRVQPTIPVIWVDTGYLPAETYQYADQLTELLALNLHVYQSELSPARMEARYGRLWESHDLEDLSQYDRLRKVEPMQKALAQLQPAGWISGLRSHQTSHRKTLSRVHHDGKRFKLLPILKWTNKEIYQYMLRHNLPQHPLWEQGYSTVGDWHSSRAMQADDSHERQTRFHGLKEECGIHL